MLRRMIFAWHIYFTKAQVLKDLKARVFQIQQQQQQQQQQKQFKSPQQSSVKSGVGHVEKHKNHKKKR